MNCKIEGCESPVVAKEMCRRHYMRSYRHGDPELDRVNARPSCSVEGCDQPHMAKGKCRRHYYQAQRHAAAQVRVKQPKACGWCGVEFTPARSGTYCSIKCKAAARADRGDQWRAVKKYQLKSQYGMTVEEYDQRAKVGCVICGRTTPIGRISKHSSEHWLHVDHDHTSGRVRGLLCTNCNRGLGFFADDPELLRRAVSYLES